MKTVGTREITPTSAIASSVLTSTNVVVTKETMMKLIDADALKEAIRKRLGISSLKYLTEQEKVIVEEIDNAPTVKTYCYFCGQTEHGKIEEIPQGGWVEIEGGGYICPNCENIEVYTPNFCPNCGARMKGGAK